MESREAVVALGDYLNLWGFLLLAAGLGLGGYAFFFFNTTVDAPPGLGMERVANLDLMQRQLMIFVSGMVATLLGGICLAAGNIIRAVAGTRNASEKAA